MPPSATYQDFQEVIFEGPVLFASYAPNGMTNDVTMQVRQLQMQGRNHITGGIHTAIGDPAPGQPKQFKVWYANKPNQTWKDFEMVQFAGVVIAASYAPAAQPGAFNDMTQQVRQLQMQGRNMINGGIHTAIGDPFPGQPKVFAVWYQ